ncbi:MAG: CocE/NonD family hydrolase, partial [Acidobacteriota bacterium]|nr:CocE/NonD family hydrolase [Acidobacteriota bacterium]
GINAHPAVKAISPQAPMTDVWMGDDFFHNGAFRQTYGFDYVQEMEAQKTDVRVDSRTDTFAQFLQEGNFANAARDAGMSSLPTARAFLEHPEYSRFWQAMAVERALHRVEVPTLEVGGTWDQEDMWGTQAQYAALHPLDTGHQVFLVLGPWNHGGWSGIGAGATLGPLQFGQATGDAYRRNVEAPFFEWYLKDRPGFDVRGVMSFRTGENRWQQYAAWPPQPRDAATRLYLTASHGVALQAPAGEGAVSYRADPAQPVPYLSRPIYSTYGSGSRWSTWMLEDQRFATSRADVAVFRSEVLDHDVTVTGDVTADLFAATTGSDADWVVKLMDVYPKDAPEPLPDYQLMIAGEIFRGRYVRSFEHPTPLVPGKVTEFRWSLHAVDHTFLKGHRIMVEVQSSWFPLYDRNPQTFVKNIMSAPAKAYRAQTQTIECSAQYPSHLELNVTPASLP